MGAPFPGPTGVPNHAPEWGEGSGILDNPVRQIEQQCSSPKIPEKS
jgi:hypothetical protein